MSNLHLLSRLDEVIVNDATYTSPAEFLATHIPFKNLKYTSSGIGDGIEKSISEEVFFTEYLLKQSHKHNFIVVQGDSGSGKSHFIRWVMEHYELNKENDDVIVSIKRHQNTLKSAIAQILQSDVFREFKNKETSQKLSNAKEQLDDSELLYSIKNNFLTKLESREDFINCNISKRESTKLIEFIKCNYAVENLFAAPGGPFNRIYQKISSNSKDKIQTEFDARFKPEDFNISLDFREEIEEYEDITKSARDFAKEIYRKEDFRVRVADYLNTYLDSVIQLCLQMNGEDFRQVIYELRKYLKSINKTLTLFIEDITSFTGIDQSLIEALNVSDHNNREICRLFTVLGTTKSYYNSFFPDNLKQRVTGRVFIEIESIFGSKDDVVTMAARYLNAINTSKDVLYQWHVTGANFKELPISKMYEKYKWSVYEDPELGELFLFPFNKRAIIHLYETLNEQTPRVFLKQVIKYVYERFINNPTDFPGKWQDFKNYYSIPQWAEELHKTLIENQHPDKSDQLACVLRVWGDRTAFRTTENGEVRLGDLPKEVFDVFSLPFVKGKETDSSHSGKDGGENSVENKTGPSISPKPPRTKKQVPETTNQKEANRKYDKEKQVLRDWFQENKKLTNHRELRTEISSFLHTFIQWEKYGVSNYLANNFFGSSFNRIGIEGQPVEINSLGLVLEKTNINYQFLDAILTYKHLGNSTWNFPNSTDYLLLISKWISLNIKDIVNLITKHDREERWDMLKWSVYNQYLICVLNGQITGKESAEEIYLHVMNAQKLKRDTEHSQNWARLLNSIKDQDITSNNDFLLKSTNLLLGEASFDTNKMFIAAHHVINEINSLIDLKWNVSVVHDVTITKSTIYVSYSLMKNLHLVIRKLIDLELVELQNCKENITSYVQEEEVLPSIYKIKSFLENTLQGKAQEFYSVEQFKIALESDEEINKFASEVVDILGEIGTIEDNDMESLIKISRLSILTLTRFYSLIQEIDKKLEQLKNKYENSIKLNEKEIIEYEETLNELKRNVGKVKKSLNLLGVSDIHADNKN
ncbi:hypothetical protein P4654_27130 [Niallia taxi]|uniref:hypothetical protein n=1 Tax=Niallia taxi TaxID=2499688 RepID=UPI002E1AF64A|nr:hypothetical protein [Niallia taxi]MED4122326.1 hypothetical protein [Niallia taxi]